MELPEDRNHYIRLERIGVSSKSNEKKEDKEKKQKGVFKVPGVIEMQEYYGLYIKYYIQAAGQSLKVIEKNDGISIYEPGEKVTLRLNPADVMSY